MKGKIKYTGGGDYLPGVPARDLTTEEWETHKVAILASPDAQRLYKIPQGENLPVEVTVTGDSGNG